jgi:hypothetical protein
VMVGVEVGNTLPGNRLCDGMICLDTFWPDQLS